jgi:hypothetical protein
MFILKAEKLLVGDIILTTQNELVSKAVRKATSSQFSHVILYIGNQSYIHADTDGVHSGNTQRLLFADIGHATVLRLQMADPTAVYHACTFARRQVGKQYSVPEAIKSRFRRHGDKPDKSNRQYCSRLVAQAYTDAGVQLVANPSYCYPVDFISSPLLYDVSDALWLASHSEIMLAQSEGFIGQHNIAINFILQQIRGLSGLDIQTFEQIQPFLMANPQHDRDVCEILKISGYLDHWKEEVLRNSWRYDKAEFLRFPMSASERTAIAREELTAGEQQLQHFIYMYGQCTQMWQQANFSYFAIKIQLYMNLIEVTKKRIETAKQIIAVPE